MHFLFRCSPNPQIQAMQGFTDRSLRDVKILIWLCSALCAAALAVCIYSIFYPL
ncbi:hypothetical protein [Pseudomonas monteilii]|uniref:hypothetical protein n=1 Tax=Pseudomonas monteilii TaxID=76759 RepID=UPI0012DAF436|nr:hypothetical protein [Pseudomonas monteilii]